MLLRSASLIFSMLLALRAGAEPVGKSVDAEGHQWWQHAVFYELYPRSFADSNADGIGDLNGITSKLDYLRNLGVDAIWITPCFPSPQVDFGYDVSDYRDIDPMYGTLADMDKLIGAARQRGQRIVLDLVVNHTSDQHPWFLDSKSSRSSKYRDWYIWRDGKKDAPPNNWISLFGGSAWQFDPTTQQYFYHFFYKQQPDLNWRNPQVAEAINDVTRWWYRRGIAGFRLDAVDTLFEDPQLRDNPVEPGKNKYGDPNTKFLYNNKLQTENNAVLRGLRNTADQFGAVLIGETWTTGVDELKAYYSPDGGNLQMPMFVSFATTPDLSAKDCRDKIATVEATGGWPVYVIGNHDIPRAASRYGKSVADSDMVAKLLAGMYLTLRGTPILYYGEELGMVNTDPARREDVKDPIGQLGWPEEKGRDGERTPMQWTPGANAGFTTGSPWLPVPESARTRNVETESADPNSVLSFYRKLIALRKTHLALRDGSYTALNQNEKNVLAYTRSYKKETVLVLLNMTGSEQKVQINVPGYSLSKVTLLLTANSHARKLQLVGDTSLPPYAVYIAQLVK